MHPLDDEGNIFFRIGLPVHPLDGGELAPSSPVAPARYGSSPQGGELLIQQ